LALYLSVIVPPYWGVPNLSHQCPEIGEVVTEVVITAVELVATVVATVVFVVVTWDAVVVVEEVFVVHDASTIAATIMQLSPSQTNRFFKFLLLLYTKHILGFAAILCFR
jgi:hypothetical protein